MVGLLDERPGRRGPVKLSPEVVAFLEARRRERPGASGAELAAELERALGVRLHRRTVERALRATGRAAVSERFWPVAEAAQADYEALRAAALAGEQPRDELAAARFARRGLAGLIAWPSVGAGLPRRDRRRAAAARGRAPRTRARRRSARPTASSSRTRRAGAARCGRSGDEGRALRARLDRAPGGARHDRLAARAAARGGARGRPRGRRRVRRRRLLRRAAGPPGAGPPARRGRGRRAGRAAVPVPGSPRARLRLPGADPRGARALRRAGALPRRPGAGR